MNESKTKNYYNNSTCRSKVFLTFRKSCHASNVPVGVAQAHCPSHQGERGDVWADQSDDAGDQCSSWSYRTLDFTLHCIPIPVTFKFKNTIDDIYVILHLSSDAAMKKNLLQYSSSKTDVLCLLTWKVNLAQI